MGEVYRARDTRLGRDVALKTLPEDLAKDPDRLRRFEREVRAASALSDPHIVTVFEVGKAGGVPFFVTELVEGSELRRLLDAGPLPPRKALDLAEQIASGLAAAHEKGIVHRDLKPENVLVTRTGVAKIADFGLAKLVEIETESISQLPTSDGHRTAAGIVMGTVAYMSPEQARGAEVDFRSDQFAFGAILYEMLAGAPAFHRGSTAETMAAILREEPRPLAIASPASPAPARWLVERCLNKDPEGRYASTSDLHYEIRSVREHLSESLSAAAAPPSRMAAARTARVRAPVLAALAAILGVAIGKFLWKSPPPPLPLYHQTTFQTGNIWKARFAPDGQTILYSARWKGGPRSTYSTRLDSTDSTELSWPHGTLFAISSTGRAAIGIMHSPPTVSSMLAEVALAGGAPREVLDDVIDADWSPDGKELAAIHETPGGVRLEYPIGNTVFDPGPAGFLVAVRFSPDGRRIAFIAEQDTTTDDIRVYDLGTKKVTRLSSGWDSAVDLVWTPSGREIWFTARKAASSFGGLVINGVDLAGRERVVARGPGLLFVKDIFPDGRVLLAHGSWPATMTFRAPGEAERDLSRLEFSIAEDLSADGKTLLFGESGISSGAAGEIFVRQTDGDAPPVRLGEGHPSGLSPDGKWAIALSSRPDRALVLLPTGAGQPINLTSPGMTCLAAGWYPDSARVLVLATQSAHAKPHLFEQRISGGPPRPLPTSASDLGAISPDGASIAAHGETGAIEIAPVAGGAPRSVPDTSAADEILRWSGDGRALFVRNGNLPARVFRIDPGTGRRELLWELSPTDRSGVQGLERPSVTADGRGYCYSFVRYLNNLYVVTGLR